MAFCLGKFGVNMQTFDIKVFRRRNKITQMELAAYLGVSQPFLSQVENGGSPLPSECLEKILANAEWDTSSAMVQGNVINGSGVVVTGDNTNSPIDNRHYYSDSPDVLRAQIELLDERIKEKDAQIKEKDAQIKEKDAQIKTLLDILAKK